VKSAYSNELPIRQLSPDKSTTSSKSRAKSACPECKTAGSNPASFFSRVASSSSSRASTCKVTPEERRVGRRTGVTPTGGSRPAVGSSQPATTRQRSPWRPANVKPVRSSNTEVDRSATRKRCLSVSSEVQRRPTDHSRAASTSRVRRTKSVPEASTLASCHNDSVQLPETPPVRELLSCDHAISHDEDPCENQIADKPQSRLPPPVVPVHSNKETPITPPKKKPSACNLIAQEVKSAGNRIVQAMSSAWKKVSSAEIGGQRTSGRFLPVLVALLFLALVFISGSVYIYMSISKTPAPLPPQPLQPSQQKPVSSYQSNTIWHWLTNVA